MADLRAMFEGKKITVMGLGLLGRGVGDTKFLAEQGAELIVTDLKTAEELQTSLDVLKEFSNITYRLGEHNLDDFRDRDYILKSPDVRPNSPYIAEAKKNGIPIKMSASWFAEIAQIPTVGVTGTRGKSTVTHLLHEIMINAGMNVLLGGNIRGVSTLALLPKVEKNSIALFELDSWQCQGWGESNMSPNIAVFTTFMPDHLNYYKGDIDAYLHDKAQIFLHQSESDTLVVGAQVAPLLKEKYKKINSYIVITDSKKFPKEAVMAIPGEHNKENALCAIEVARTLGIDEEIIVNAVNSFKGVAGRLESLGEVNGTRIYNDTTSTTPDALRVALEAFESESKNVVLIMGGSDKEINPNTFPIEKIQATKKTMLLSGSGTETIQHLLPHAPIYSSLSEAVDDAFNVAKEGDIILFSPGFASFGMFKNEFDRGDQFIELVKSYE